MDVEFVDLYTLQRDLKEGLGDLFPDSIWVKAEIAQISVKSGGHCYLELVQSEAGTVIAKVRAVIWKGLYTLLAAKFRAATGGDLSAGLEILARVTVSFHEVYGLSLVIDDIDISSAIGDRELKRQQTIERLTKEGLTDRQQSLQLAQLHVLLLHLHQRVELGRRGGRSLEAVVVGPQVVRELVLRKAQRVDQVGLRARPADGSI